MSWSVSTSGKIADVQAELDRQFAWALADAPAGLQNGDEKETVRQVVNTIAQVLRTFDPEKSVTVSAGGHISFDDYSTCAGAVQTVSVSIKPVA